MQPGAAVRPAAAHPANAVVPSAPRPSYSPGQHVEIFSDTYGKWVPGTVVSGSQDSSAGVTVRYDAGGLQKTLPCDRLSQLLRPLAEASLPSPQTAPTQRPAAAAVDTVVFLDVDGVLHSLYGDEIFAESCCAALETVLCESGGRVVLMNSWSREGGERITMVDDLLRQRSLQGLYDRTSPPRSRPEEEICEWLDRHPEVVRWVALDDADLEVGRSPAADRVRGRCARPDKHVGLTATDAQRALAVLRQGASGASGVEAAPPALSAEEQRRAAASRAAEAQHWDELRNGDFAEMERNFFGDDSP